MDRDRSGIGERTNRKAGAGETETAQKGVRQAGRCGGAQVRAGRVDLGEGPVGTEQEFRD